MTRARVGRPFLDVPLVESLIGWSSTKLPLKHLRET